MRAREDYGDGDHCPSDPAHGRMYVMGKRQYCPHSGHDGTPGKAGQPRTRSFFPLYPERSK